MADRTHNLTRLAVGDTVPCDVRDAHGTLLMREGRVATSEKQIETLIRHGSPSPAPVSGAPDRNYRPPSPLALVLGARRNLAALLADPSPVDFSTTVLKIAAAVRKACRMNADVALASILRCRDEPYAVRHPVNVAIASCVVGSTLPIDDAMTEVATAAALTMNIGMFDLQHQLQAVAGPLDASQRTAVRTHPARGVVMLRERGVTDDAWLAIVQDHHERIDGSGYPAGKAGGVIDPPTQLVSLADIYCARVSGRLHRAAMQPNVALRWLFLNEGAAVDERHAALFIKTLGVYPPGTGVRLQNGSIGVVTHRGSAGQRPRVSSITTQDGLRVSVPIRRSADLPGHAVVEVLDLDRLGYAVGMEALWGDDAVV